MIYKFSSVVFKVVLLFVLLQQTSIAQQDYIKFRHLTIEQGLSLNSIFAITQDKYGFMWFGSSDGLNRFDGKNVVIYKHDPENTNSLSSKRIYTLMEDSNGLLWIGTANGLNSYDYTTQTFTRFLHDPDNPNSISNNTVRSLYEDYTGGFWIGTDNGLNYFNREEKTFTHYKHNPDKKGSISHNRIWSIYEDKQGIICIGTPGGLNRFDKNKQSFTVYDKITDNAQKEVHSICEDKHGNLWLGTRKGIVCINQKNQTFKLYTEDKPKNKTISHNKVWRVFADNTGTIWAGTLGGGLNKISIDSKGKIKKLVVYQKERSDPSSLNHNYVWSIYQDRTGVLWFGTEAGLNIYDTHVKKFTHYKHHPENANSLIHDEVNVFCEGQDGALWIGTRGGLNKYDIKNNRFYNFSTEAGTKNSITNDYIRAIFIDREGLIWLGTDGGGLTCYDERKNKFRHYLYTADKKDNTNYNKILTIYEDKEKNLWLGTLAGLGRFDRNKKQFYFYQSIPDDPQTLSHNYIYLIYEDKQGRLWVGTDNGLNRFNRKTKKFIRYLKNPNNPNSLSNNTILSIYEDEEGILWIGTAGGLNRFNPANETFIHFREKDGLVNEVIFGLLADNRGNLWLSSNKGLARFSPTNKKIKIFSSDDGLQSDQFNMGAFYKARDGRMYFGGINGFNSFYPDEIKNNPFLPQVVLTDFKMLNKSVPIGTMDNGRIILEKSIIETESINLTYEDKIISFEFSALQFNNPSKNNYAYLMMGLENNWNFVGNRNHVTYTTLPHGEYEFKVKASNNDDVWNQEVTTIKINIQPPFYDTTWFKFLVFIFVVSTVFIGYKLRMRSVQRKKHELEVQVQERTKELNSRNKELVKSKKETDDILHNVNDGLFLLNRDFIIESQYSAALEEILYDEDLAKRKFTDYLSGKIEDEIVDATNDFLELMFEKNHEETMLKELNPIANHEFVFKDKGNRIKRAKNLTFDFKRIRENGDIVAIMATVNDITHQVRLTKELEKSKEKSEIQLKWMMTILKVDPVMLKEFINNVQEEITEIENQLEHESIDIQTNLTNIYRSVHLIKGNASLLELNFIAEQSHQIEEKIKTVINKTEINPEEFNELKTDLDLYKNTFEEVKTLIDKISDIHNKFRPKRKFENELLLKSLQNLVKNLSVEYDKKVKLDVENFDISIIPYKYRFVLRDVLVQLTRNAIYHGIENKDVRCKNKKDESGKIKISNVIEDHTFSLSFFDDGCGLDLNNLKEKAKKLGKWSNEEIASWNKEDITKVIFVPGLTTSSAADMVAGRGMGMDIIKQKVENNGGRIKIEFEPNQFCEFIIELPLEEMPVNIH